MRQFGDVCWHVLGGVVWRFGEASGYGCLFCLLCCVNLNVQGFAFGIVMALIWCFEFGAMDDWFVSLTT